MKRVWFVLCGFLWTMAIVAQVDPVVMRVKGKNILRSEFMEAYARCRVVGDQMLSPNEFATLYSTRLLQIAAAKEAGLDTTFSFRQQHEAAQQRQLERYWIATLQADSCFRMKFQQKKQPVSCVQVQQVLSYLSQTISAGRLEEQIRRMDSIYQAIKHQPEVDFQYWVKLFSDDKETRWLTPLQETAEFHQVVSSLPQGAVSAPFMTPVGIHVVKVVARKELLPDEEAVASRREWLKQACTGESMVQKLKKELAFVSHQEGINELLRRGQTTQLLFCIGDTAYTGEDFSFFAQSHPQALQRQLDLFITKSLLDCKSRLVTQCQPDVRREIQQSDEAYLIKEVVAKYVDKPAATDRAGWKAYFEVHRSEYRWDSSRFKGIVVHCADKKTAKLVKKLLKKTSPDVWNARLKQRFASTEAEQILIEQGVFEEGMNPYVDQKVFKKRVCSPYLSHPFTVVAGKKQKGPDGYSEVLDRVKEDYRSFLYATWMKNLKAAGKVEMVLDVLKTVNNN